VRQLADATANVTLTRSYAPYGDTLTSTGTGTTAWQFAGEQRDASGLTFLRARYLSTATGRFITQDEWPGEAQLPATLHPYLYGLNNPIWYTDPSGRCVSGAVVDSIICGAVIGATVGAAWDYGTQVYKNYQSDPSSGLWQAATTNINGSSIGRAALIGAVSGAVGGGVAAGVAGYLGVTATTAATMTLGQAVAYGAVIGAASGGASGGATQIVDNVLNCRDWHYHLPEALLFGMGTGAVMGGCWWSNWIWNQIPL